MNASSALHDNCSAIKASTAPAWTSSARWPRCPSADLTPRERLLAVFDSDSPLCPFIAAAVEIPDPGHPARVYARGRKQAFAARLAETAREAGAARHAQVAGIQRARPKGLGDR